MGISIEQRFDLGKNHEEIISQDSLWQYRPKQSTQHGPDKHSEHYAKKGIDDGLRRYGRRDWIKRGMPWSSKGIPRPPDWNPEAQLQNLR